MDEPLRVNPCAVSHNFSSGRTPAILRPSAAGFCAYKPFCIQDVLSFLLMPDFLRFWHSSCPKAAVFYDRAGDPLPDCRLGGIMETSDSLLERLRTAPDEAAWRRLDDIYRPLIQRWLLRDPALRDEAEDIVQEAMDVLFRELPNFQRRRTGSFRHWLRDITIHRLLNFQRARRHRPQTLGASADQSPLAQLADPSSELSRLWDEEHDHFVLRRLMDLIAPQFEANTLAAFRRVAFDGVAPAQVARDLGLTSNAVLIAKSRVLTRLRQEAEGLVD